MADGDTLRRPRKGPEAAEPGGNGMRLRIVPMRVATKLVYNTLQIKFVTEISSKSRNYVYNRISLQLSLDNQLIITYYKHNREGSHTMESDTRM